MTVMMNWKTQFIFLFVSLLIVAPASVGQSGEDDGDQKKQFAYYHELVLDMEVKVQSGAVRIYRSWEGDKKRWVINPQHQDLSLSEETQGDAYGHALAREISRGPRKMKQGGTVGLFSSGSGGEQGSASIPGPLASSMGAIISANSLTYCTNGGERAIEAMHVGPEGYKWVNGIGRRWAQFDFEGRLQSWGRGNYLIARVLIDKQMRQSGYADSSSEEVITYTRDAQGRIEKITDYEGREVLYTYNAQGLLENVTDPEGVVTHYEYLEGNIVLKKIGDGSTASPEEEAGEETTLVYTYYSSDGELRSIRTLDGTQVDLVYEYNEDEELYVTTRYESGNRITKTTRSAKDGLISVEKNGEYHIRVVPLCEDTAIVDKHNRITYVDRDELGYILKVVFPDGRQMTFEHSNENWPEVGDVWNGQTQPWGVVAINYPSGRRVEYERDEKGQMRKATEYLENETTRYWSFDYDSSGNMTQQRLQAGPNPDDALDHVTEWSYDTRGNVESHNVGLAAPPWLYEYNSRGDVTKVTAPDGEEWNFTYTGKGKLKTFSDPVGYQQIYEYSKRGLLKEYREIYDTGQEAITRFFYNHRGLVTKVVDPFGAEWLYEYTGSGELKIATDPEGKKIFYAYDPRGRIKSVADANGVAVTYDYFDTAPPGQAPQIAFSFSPRVHINYPTFTEELQYDFADRLTLQTLRPESGVPQQIGYEYDADDRLTAIVRPDGERVEYGWDQLSRLTSITQPGWGTTSIDFPENVNKVIYNDPIGGNVTYDFDSRGQLTKETRADSTEVRYQYDINGNLEHYINAKGQKIKLVYDDAQQVSSLEIFSSEAAVTPVRTIQYTRNLRGDLKAMVDGSVTQQYTLDSIGRILQASTTYDGGFTKSHSYTYSPNGLPASQTLVDGTTLNYFWDQADQFSGFVIPGTGMVSFGYDSENWFQPNYLQFPGGSKQNYEYDDLRRLKRIHSEDHLGNTFLDYNYGFVDGPLSGSAISSISTEHGEYQFQYDEAFRVTDATYADSSEVHYSYDALGRRQMVGEPPWTYDEHGAVTDTGDTQFTYDADGNRRTQTDATGTTEYFYDESDRLIRVEKPLGNIIARYYYDSFGRRLWKEVSGQRTYFYYNEDGLAAELDNSGNVTKSYLFAPGGYWSTSPIAMKEAGQYHYFHGDHLGTPQKITQESSATSWEARYSAYGQATVLNPSIVNNLRLPGQYFDPETGLHQNFQRNYDPTLGAYLEQDPFGVTTTGPNRYLYSYGDPTNLFDPTGEIVPAVAGAALGVLFVVDRIHTGFQVYQCFNYFLDSCNNPFNGEACIDVGVGALLGAGLGHVVGLVGKRVLPLGWKGRAVPEKTVPKLLPSPRDYLLSSVADAKLKRRIDKLYRRDAKIGNGSTADAIRHELRTGELLSPKGHYQKGIEMRNGLMKDLKSGRLNAKDTDIARELLKDLQNALLGQ